MKERRNLPELLCPAGTPQALLAAIEGGADAVYLGGSVLNARMHAGNFDKEQLVEAVRTAHLYHVKVYLTLNTLVSDKEIPTVVGAATEAQEAGVDALIVADLGAAMAIHQALPNMELHASTQMSGHNSDMGKELQKLGFSRMVLAREISEANLFATTKSCPIETELFVHGALCVCHSGQCLFSSVVGGRSGNRGECAQPCRLPFGGKDKYPLSLKDLSLAAYIPEIIKAGVTSLKIEGRMKSPEYVRDTARIFRRLLDERRAATERELKELSEVFSRGGLTAGYFEEKIDCNMLGIRSQEDKANSRELQPFTKLERKLPVSLSFTAKRGEPMELTLSRQEKSLTVIGEIPQEALNTPTTEEQILAAIGKLGDTPYAIERAEIHLEEGLMIPASFVKSLRRKATEKWMQEELQGEDQREKTVLPLQLKHPKKENTAPARSARFERKEQITKTARAYFDRIFLPLFAYEKIADGVVMPPVIFEEERAEVLAALKAAKEQGATCALVGNLGHMALAKEAGLILYGDYRLNAYNRQTLAFWQEYGLKSLILSPELSIPQLRDIGGNSEVFAYGRIPLMTLEKCVVKEIADCERCKSNSVKLTDRMGITFPVIRAWKHRNIVYNSIPTCMSDKQDAMTAAGLTSTHFLFSTETPEEVDKIIQAYLRKQPISGQVRRIKL